MCATSGSDEIIMPNNGIKSPTSDDANNVGTVEGHGRLKKGPWTSAEDAILVEYVTKHGEGNWNAVQRHTGLARCGKSCRLRWANHLRPDLKKGAFTPEEEHLIIELHAKMGNKWARMAAEMPGRTDNEIKNYWNTRIKRRLRAGLPIYPPDISLHASNENQQKDNMSNFSSGDAHTRDAIPVNNFEIPSVEFQNLESNQHVPPPPFLDLPVGGFLDITGSGFVPHALHSPYPNKSVLPTMHPRKRIREPESMFPSSSDTMTTMHPRKHFRGTESIFPSSSDTVINIVPEGSQYQMGSYVQNAQPFIFSSEYDHNSTFDHPSSSILLGDSHAVINCNPSSSSEATWAMKQELPSLQTQADNWGSASSPLPPLESADTLIHTPPSEHNPSCQFTSQNSDILDVVLHDSQTMEQPRNSYDLLSSHAFSMDGSSQLIHGHETGLETYGELTSPFGHSSSSMFGEGTGESETGFRVAEEANMWFPTHYDSIKGETPNQMLSQQDLLLDSNCFGPKKERNTC